MSISFSPKIWPKKSNKIKALITGVAGSYDVNREPRYCQFFSKDWTKIYVLLGLIPFFFCQCTKDSGKNPSLAFTDQALLDSSRAGYHHYYKNDSIKMLTGNKNSNGPHGDFKLRFNTVAFKALLDSGKLAAGASMPDGSLVIKDIYSGSQISLYAIMYKRSGAWVWSEVKPDGEVLYSVFKNPNVCVSCHSQAGNRDLLRTFSYY